MFFWVTRGVSEVYIPPVQPEIIRPLHSITLSSPVKKKPESEQNTERKSGTKKALKEIGAEYKTFSSLGKIRRGEPISSLTAKDLMTSPVVFFLESEPISRVQDIFVQKRFRHVPVLDEKNTLCGIISDRDWMRWKLEHISETELGKTIGKIMKTRVLSVQIQAGIGEIVKVLFEERIGCLPVVNDSFQAIGIITRSDVLRAILRINEREFLA
ncbi:CBS domain-containing protein [Leptospira borgpetersenii]|uniref:CBS domain-containing protein n=1 Tax=Leptospira borgpetersenii TaxID=174 RepID=UPI000348A8CD|nr:CBS domain-containing protein [Leptospira borgpetersenii]URD69613.1 CBS domain-containing protein [Leptospira borgpetersenii]UVD72789.1 CBS domain-containing protein [Leptospira borgpetersenii]UVD75983.1 CBS domain-containing protein [Leptospira borgpetersenii]UZW32541.1 CBS domain-containing protein [Leptospira borgpetersenii]